MQLAFFNTLDNIIESFDNPLGLDETIDLYLLIYKNIHKANDIETSVFQEVLENHFNNESDSMLNSKAPVI